MAETTPGSAPESPKDPLEGLDLSQTGYEKLNEDQKKIFIKMIVYGREVQKMTTEQLNNPESLTMLVLMAERATATDRDNAEVVTGAGIAVARPRNIADPAKANRSIPWEKDEPAIVAAEVVENPLSRSSSNNAQRLALALGLGGLGLTTGIAGIGLATHEVAEDVRHALLPTPAVAPVQGPTTFNAPRAVLDFRSTEGGFGVAKSSDGQSVVVRPSNGKTISSVVVNNSIKFDSGTSLRPDAQGNFRLDLEGDDLKNVQIFYTNNDGASRTDTINF